MLILASQSPIRSTLLNNAGVSHHIQASSFDESRSQAELSCLTPKALAQALAEAKALSVSRIQSDALVIGADQTLEFNGACFHKSKDLTAARNTLLQLRGKCHYLHSAVTITQADRVIFSAVDTAKLTMRDFSLDALDHYIAESSWDMLHSVGCYQLEGLGVQLFEGIEGDYFTILGLPLLPLLAFLREIGELPA